MDNNMLKTKVKLRLNKLASLDYDNIEDWQIQEAFNKAQLEYARREALKGEESKYSNEAIEQLLTSIDLLGSNQEIYYESINIPDNYLSYKRISTDGITNKCKKPRRFKVYPGRESNVSDLLRDTNMNPNFEWGETFFTLIGKKVRIYTDSKFIVVNPKLIYYRKPKPINIIGSVNPSDGTIYNSDIFCEFKDDIAEFLVDEAVAILAGDIESIAQVQRNLQNASRNEP